MIAVVDFLPKHLGTIERKIKEMNEGSRRTAIGREVLKQVYGDRVTIPANAEEIPFWNLMLGSTFADMWGRDEMSIRDRRLILIGCIAAVASTGLMEIQLNAALDKEELNLKQLREIPVLLHHYIGLPRASETMTLVERLISERTVKS